MFSWRGTAFVGEGVGWCVGFLLVVSVAGGSVAHARGDASDGITLDGTRDSRRVCGWCGWVGAAAASQGWRDDMRDGRDGGLRPAGGSYGVGRHGR